MHPVYEAYRYAGDGRAEEVDPDDPARTDGAVIAIGTLDECRRAIARAGNLMEPRFSGWRWGGAEGDVEAYRESDLPGCGGWAIRPVAAAAEQVEAPPLAATELRQAGEILFGESGWQTRLAEELGVGDRSVRRWLSGERAVPAGLRADLARLARERGEHLLALAERLESGSVRRGD